MRPVAHGVLTVTVASKQEQPKALVSFPIIEEEQRSAPNVAATVAETMLDLTGSVTPPPRARHLERRFGPFQARKDRASHHPVLVALRQEAQLFGEMGDALAVACVGE
jgi:hypothetical protein